MSMYITRGMADVIFPGLAILSPLCFISEQFILLYLQKKREEKKCCPTFAPSFPLCFFSYPPSVYHQHIPPIQMNIEILQRSTTALTLPTRNFFLSRPTQISPSTLKRATISNTLGTALTSLPMVVTRPCFLLVPTVLSWWTTLLP